MDSEVDYTLCNLDTQAYPDNFSAEHVLPRGPDLSNTIFANPSGSSFSAYRHQSPHNQRHHQQSFFNNGQTDCNIQVHSGQNNIPKTPHRTSLAHSGESRYGVSSRYYTNHDSILGEFTLNAVRGQEENLCADAQLDCYRSNSLVVAIADSSRNQAISYGQMANDLTPEDCFLSTSARDCSCPNGTNSISINSSHDTQSMCADMSLRASYPGVCFQDSDTRVFCSNVQPNRYPVSVKSECCVRTQNASPGSAHSVYSKPFRWMTIKRNQTKTTSESRDMHFIMKIFAFCLPHMIFYACVKLLSR